MTFEALEEYLQQKKREGEAECGYDLCGNYARCDYCDRAEKYPCAHAHNRLLERMSSPDPAPVDAWKLPEPPVRLKFGVSLAQEELAPPPEEHAEEPVQTEPAESGECVEPVQTEPEGSGESVEKRGVITRGKRGQVRLISFRRKQKRD